MRPSPTKVLLRTETDFAAAFQFLQLNGYPYFWSPSDLSSGLVVRVMSDDGDTLGYVWGEWLEAGVLSFHACARSGARLPLFGSDLLDQLIRIGFLVGADRLATSVTDHHSPRPLERLLRRLGFAEERHVYGRDICFTLNTWSYLGRQEIQDFHSPRDEERRRG